MISHLKNEHKIKKEGENFEEALSDYDSDLEMEETNSVNANLTEKKKREFDRIILDFIVNTNQAISIVEHPSFRNMVKIC